MTTSEDFAVNSTSPVNPITFIAKPHHFSSNKNLTFADLGLSPAIVAKVETAGFISPTPVQQRVIPALLSGQDVLALAQTGTGKTAAFVLPLLEKIDTALRAPQLLVLTPTRELAQQVAAVFSQFSSNIRVAAVYGGQGMREQLHDLERGTHVVVGTPGRIMDHIRRRSLSLKKIQMVVLDEADEMLNMGFSESIEWILGQTNNDKQVALLSATMPSSILKIAHVYLKDHVEIKIPVVASEAPTIDQRYLIVSHFERLDALCRIIESDNPKGALVFVRTKSSTIELAESLIERGFKAAAMNGDLQQKSREALITQLKEGKLQVLVATGVAARGIDVDRIELVVNYELPDNLESYLHRIGRTGRAGRKGKAIVFLSNRDRRFLGSLREQGKGEINEQKLPTRLEAQQARLNRFKNEVTSFLGQFPQSEDLEKVIEEIAAELNVSTTKIAAALARKTKLKIDFAGENDISQESRGESRDSNQGFERRGRRGGDRGQGKRLDFKPFDKKRGERRFSSRSKSEGTDSNRNSFFNEPKKATNKRVSDLDFSSTFSKASSKPDKTNNKNDRKRGDFANKRSKRNFKK
jgi:ATP-dependent RNA helicase DeaD